MGLIEVLTLELNDILNDMDKKLRTVVSLLQQTPVSRLKEVLDVELNSKTRIETDVYKGSTIVYIYSTPDYFVITYDNDKVVAVISRTIEDKNLVSRLCSIVNNELRMINDRYPITVSYMLKLLNGVISHDTSMFDILLAPGLLLTIYPNRIIIRYITIIQKTDQGDNK